MRRFLGAFQSQIRYQIILPYLALTLLVMAVGAAISTALVAASWEERLTNQLAQVGRSTTTALVQREIDHLAYLLQVVSAPSNPSTGALSTADAIAGGQPDQVQKTLRPYYDYGIASVSLDFDRLIAFDTQSRALVDWLRTADDVKAAPTLIQGTDLSSVEAVRNVATGTTVDGNDKFANLIRFQPDPQPYFYTVVPVRRNNQVVGGVLLAIKVDRLLKSIEKNTQAAVTLFYDIDGIPIGSSLLRRADELPQFEMPEAARNQLSDGRAQSIFDREIRDQEYELAYSPLVIASRQIGYFSVGLSRDFQVQSVSISRNAIIALTMALTIGAIFLGYWVARRITTPLSSLVAAAEEVTAGNLERRTNVNSNNELGRLARAFNQMTEHLLRLYRTSRELNAMIEVDSVIDVTARTLREFAPDTEVFALLDHYGTWRYRLHPDASGGLKGLMNLRVSPEDPLLRDLVQGHFPRQVTPVDEPRLAQIGLTSATGFQSLLLTPLVLQDTFAGVLVFGHPEPNAFSGALEPTVVSVANMAASVLCNAVLFDRIHEEAGERQAILQSIADGVIVCDHQGNIVLVNKAAESMLGLRDWHIVRRHFDDVPLERVQVGPLLFGADQPAPEHYRLGDRVFGLSRAPVVADSNGAGAFGEVIVLHDISTESAVDEAKNNFIATISHELRTPLTPICGNSELLLRGTFGELNPDQRELLENVRTRAEQLRDLVNNIVLIASLQANTLQIELEPQDVWITVEHVVAPLRRLFKRKGLELVINLPEGLPSVVADREHLRLVLTQLLDNARRYTQTGGVTVTAARYDSMVQIDITDTGPGIPQEEFPRLFTRFHRVAGNNSPERGSGLGLAITRQLVERQGGHVWAHSALGQGSTFSLALPIADEHDDAIVGRENADTTA